MGKSFHNITFFIVIGYIIIVCIFLFWHRVGFSPDQFFVVALLITLLLGRMKQFIHDWSIPVVLFLSYDYLRRLVPKLTINAYVYPMINFDKAVFGSIPVNILQDFLFKNGVINWYDYLATIFYMSHFIVPMVLAFILWLKNKKYFEQYTLSLIIVSYAAFVTFILFPAVPPWMASERGAIPNVYKIMNQVFASLPQPVDLPSAYQFFGANLVAAVPSLHAAYPWLTLLFFITASSKPRSLRWLVAIYVLGVWFSLVYLGEHYVFDILIGAIYATFSYILVFNSNKIWQRATQLIPKF